MRRPPMASDNLHGHQPRTTEDYIERKPDGAFLIPTPIHL